MMPTSPFGWIPATKQKTVFIYLLILTLIVLVSLQALDGALKTAAAPQGIVSYEVAGDLTTAQAMLDSWGTTGQVYAGLSLGLDFLFLFAYAGSIGLGCVLIARTLAEPGNIVHRAGNWLAWGLLAAAFLDYLENYALIRTLLGAEAAFWPTMARWCALPKFVLIGIGLLYAMIGGIVILLQRRHSY